MPVSIYYGFGDGGGRQLYSTIDKSKPFELGTENLQYYVNVINSGLSRICKSSEIIDGDPLFAEYFGIWRQKNHLSFQLMIKQYIKQKILTNNKNNVTDIMKITITGRNCLILSAEIHSIDSLKNFEKSILSEDMLHSKLLSDSLFFSYHCINPKTIGSQLITISQEILLQEDNDYSIEHWIEVINNNNNL